MDILEKDYVKTKKEIATLQKHIKARRLKLNSLANQLLGHDEEYEFIDFDIVIKKPTHHSASKKSKD